MPNLKPVKCKASDPKKCRFHGKKAYAYETQQRKLATKLKEEREYKEKTELIRLQVGFDLEKNLKPKVLPSGETIVSVYRSGNPAPPKERGVEKDSYLSADIERPEGHQDRTTAVFASPTIGGVTRWVRGNNLAGKSDLKVRELRVDYDKTFVYSVEAWENYSSALGWRNQEDIDKAAKNYWDSGISMREWVKRVRTNPVEHDPSMWELLIPEENIHAIKPVGMTRVLAFDPNPYHDNELKTLLK